MERFCVDVGDDPLDYRESHLERSLAELDQLVDDDRPSRAELAWDAELGRRDA